PGWRSTSQGHVAGVFGCEVLIICLCLGIGDRRPVIQRCACLRVLGRRRRRDTPGPLAASTEADAGGLDAEFLFRTPKRLRLGDRLAVTEQASGASFLLEFSHGDRPAAERHSQERDGRSKTLRRTLSLRSNLNVVLTFGSR